MLKYWHRFLESCVIGHTTDDNAAGSGTPEGAEKDNLSAAIVACQTRIEYNMRDLVRPRTQKYTSPQEGIQYEQYRRTR